jgi:hypothetical protein
VSIASSPTRIVFRGHAHPQVVTLARAIQHAGWRVTSVYRPTGNHARGVALDAAPMIMTQGGFGLKTAHLLWQFAKQTVPQSNWLAVAEADHIHVQLFDYDALGINTPNGTRIVPINQYQGTST